MLVDLENFDFSPFLPRFRNVFKLSIRVIVVRVFMILTHTCYISTCKCVGECFGRALIK